MNENPVELRLTAEGAAIEAGKILKESWSGPLRVMTKGFRDWVTDADLASQDFITSYILQRFPDHGFITEEEAPDLAEDGEVVWIIDPLDGTSNFSRRHPIFCVSVAAAARDRQGGLTVISGAIYDPMREELFSASVGQGSNLNGKSITVSDCDTLEKSIIGLDWSRDPGRRQAILGALEALAQKVHSVRAIGSAALALAWVACGRLDVYFNAAVGPWDAAAARVIITEAGGMVSDSQGSPWTTSKGTCVASNGILHQPFMYQSRLSSLL